MNGGAPDPEVVGTHLRAIRTAVAHLKGHQGRPLAELHSSTDELWIVERGLQLCAQNALDVATHLTAAAGLDAPDYATAIDLLVRLGVLPPDFAARFRSVAGFRNVIVHAYLEVDVATLHEVLNERLSDFIRFADLVERGMQT